jgi:hypothetical protein
MLPGLPLHEPEQQSALWVQALPTAPHWQALEALQSASLQST